jgi:hypothetical protein
MADQTYMTVSVRLRIDRDSDSIIVDSVDLTSLHPFSDESVRLPEKVADVPYALGGGDIHYWVIGRVRTRELVLELHDRPC